MNNLFVVNQLDLYNHFVMQGCFEEHPFNEATMAYSEIKPS